ncbi:lysozyme inhibitor LprI family protein [Polaromonas sp. YR568]|uniref:lysozyme inhibitor LprI family protein n=1 Tax=Polaromonas sp. YR568 TaxID=1855301 RepID=UPI00398BC202
MLFGTPGSIEARACFARELAALNTQMTTVVKAIEQKAQSGHTAFKAKDLADSQIKWKRHVDSTCWLDAAGAGNSNAVFDYCVSAYVVQRLGQLKNLRAGLDGEPVMWPMSNLDPVK